VAAAAHDLIHRDLKPSNIMLTGDSEVKVIDFGLAKAITDVGGEMDLTHGEFVGTPTFASPEQFGGGPADARSDIYALGGTLCLRSRVWHHTLARPWTKFAIVKRAMACRSRN